MRPSSKLSRRYYISPLGPFHFLKTAVERGRLAHSYIFVGGDEQTKRLAARDLAMFLVCLARKEEGPCRECPACRKVLGFNHPDIQWLGPEGQFIRIDRIREAARRLALRGFESADKVLVIQEAQCLNEESANALLKTLEEPSGGSVIILLAPSLKMILPTLVSRCQRIAFPLLAESQLESFLRSQHHLEDEAALYLARLCEGDLSRAVFLHENGLFLKKDRFIQDIFDCRVPLVKLLEGFLGDKLQKSEAAGIVLRLLAAWFRDLLLAKTIGRGALFVDSGRTDEIMRVSGQFCAEEIESIISAIADTTADIARNINMKISLAKLRTEICKN